MKAIATQNAPAAIGPYSQAIEANGTVYVSGQLGIDPSTGSFAEGGAVAQARQSLTNISNILKEAGMSMKNVVKVTVLLADINDFAAVNRTSFSHRVISLSLSDDDNSSLMIAILRIKKTTLSAALYIGVLLYRKYYVIFAKV